jgi:1-acyl-sn-glycerol-3-phosphate acyltransferase
VIRDVLRTAIEAVFRVLFSYDCTGEEQIPTRGPAIVASNHPSYLDPILLSLQVKRRIRFMAWDTLFRVPLVGSLIRLFGAFPVDVRPGRGQSAFAAARSLVEAGEVVGIFPEGKRSRAGWLEPELRAGAARLALETGAPLVPATIRGAFRAWPHFRKLPGLAKIHVRYHEAIDPTPFRGLALDEGVEALLAELRRRVERTLLPGVKADRRIEELYRTGAPWPRLFEVGPALGLALYVFWKTRSFAAVWAAYAYVGYLLLDLLVVPQRRLSKWIRNGSAAAFMLLYTASVLPRLGLPAIVGERALIALLAGAGLAYLYEKGRTALAFVQGLVVSTLIELGALMLWPTPLGPHVALPLFAAAFAWEERTVFWRFAVPVLAAYGLGVPLWLGAGPLLLPHALAGLLGWITVRVLSRRAASPAANGDEGGGATTSLGLRDQ